jgi:hypothetical protein
MTAAERMRRYPTRKRSAGSREVTVSVETPRARPVASTGAGARPQPRSAAKDYLAMATTGCNVSLRMPISAQTLARVLAGREEPGAWWTHLRVFFTELPVEVVAGVTRQLGCPSGRLRRLYGACGARSSVMDDYLGTPHDRA